MKPFHELKRLEPGLEYLGIRNVKKIHWNLCSPKLYEQATKKGEGVMSHLGPLVIVRPSPITHQHRPGAQRQIHCQRRLLTKDTINWGDVNIAF